MQLVFAAFLAVYFGGINPTLHDTDFLVNRPCLRWLKIYLSLACKFVSVLTLSLHFNMLKIVQFNYLPKYASCCQPTSPPSTPIYPPLLADNGRGSQTLGIFLRYEEACVSHREKKVCDIRILSVPNSNKTSSYTNKAGLRHVAKSLGNSPAKGQSKQFRCEESRPQFFSNLFSKLL
jgi:hypothetical protein